MDVRMEYTGGLGKEAEVWVQGSLLCVCDGVSRPGKPCPPGQLEDVKFSYLTEGGFAWSQAVRGNPGERRRLEPVRRWAYVGFGRVVQVMPVLVDFGLLTMEDANWTNDKELVGKYVRIPIDRLEISRAHRPDWPREAAGAR